MLDTGLSSPKSPFGFALEQSYRVMAHPGLRLYTDLRWSALDL